MPASDVTISVLTRITDYTIATTLITGYTGSETEVVMPSSYYPYQQETRNTLRFENMGEFTSYIEQTGGANIVGGHFTYKTADSQDYSDVVKDAMAWMGEAMTYTEDQFPLLINLPTEYSISLEDQKTLSEDSLFYGIIGPFTSLDVNTILSFTIQIGNDEPVDINVSGGSILDDIMACEESEVFNMLPIAFSNIKYGSTIACVGEGINLSTIDGAAFSNNTNITQVTIPEGFTTIDYSAFENCTNLYSVSIPSSITYIDDSAFNNCTSLNYNENNNGKYLGNTSNPYLVLVDVIDSTVTNFTFDNDCKIIDLLICVINIVFYFKFN